MCSFLFFISRYTEPDRHLDASGNSVSNGDSLLHGESKLLRHPESLAYNVGLRDEHTRNYAEVILMMRTHHIDNRLNRIGVDKRSVIPSGGSGLVSRWWRN